MISLVQITPHLFPDYERAILEIEQVSFPSPWSARLFMEEAKNPLSTLWVVKEGGEVAGFICFWVVRDQIHLLNIAVHPAKRRKGFATYMLKKMVQKGLEYGAKEVWLEVRPSNLAALNLYEKLGFYMKGRRPRYYSDTGEDAIVMTLSLNQVASQDGFTMATAQRVGVESGEMRKGG